MEWLDVAYAAGFFDGEGCISMGKGRPKRPQYNVTYQLRATVANVNKAVLQWLQDRWGGTIVVYQPKGNRKRTYRWWLKAQKAERFLAEVSPFLKIKVRQADVARRWNVHRRKWGDRRFHYLPPEQINEREIMYQELRQLNHVGRGRYIHVN